MFAKFLAIALVAVSSYAAPCFLSHTVTPGDTLPDLGSFYFGDGDFASAILVATNSRANEGFSFISDPYRLATGSAVCIPDALEAGRSRARYATYRKAIAGTMVTEPWETTRALVTFPSNREVIVATWTRASQVSKYRTAAPQDTWVTVEPHLKEFCRAFAKAHDGNQDELTLRLEQRLGMPPAAGDDTFLRIRLRDVSAKTIFRPCSDPATGIAHCEAGPPSDKNPAYAAWFYKQFYSSYGLPRPNLYPWTSLGYTFDWAQGSDEGFVRYGESEFVIPAGTPIESLGSVSTAEYCRLTGTRNRGGSNNVEVRYDSSPAAGFILY